MDEFSLIQQYFSNNIASPTDESIVLGIGDDTAVIQPPENEELLFTTDTLIQGVHFPENTAVHAIGHKSLAVNLSDIAAMGGTARWFTLALSLPEAHSSWLQAFSDGMFALANKHDVKLVGGDTTRGPLSVTISVIGTSQKGEAVKRSGAREHDIIFVTGNPGMASVGLNSILNNSVLPLSDASLFVDKLNYPEPRLQEGLFLRDYATSMIDISDGLSADIGHIIEASKCGAILDIHQLTKLVPQSLDYTDTEALERVLSGGDDYELLFTVPAEKCDEMKTLWPEKFAMLSRIGSITAGSGVSLRDSTNKIRKLNTKGYNHFDD